MDPEKKDKYVQENIKAEEAIASGNLADAAAILISLVEKDPENWRAFNSMGIIAWLQKSWQDAYTMFLRSVNLNPFYTDALINLFDAALKLKKVDQVTPFLQNAAQASNASKEVKIILESILEHKEDIYYTPRGLSIGIYYPLVEEGSQLLDEGNLNSALDKFIKSLETDGPNPGAYCGLGIVSYYQKRYEDAYTFFKESIRLNPFDHDTFLNLLDAAIAAGLELEAYELFNLYKKEYPSLDPLSGEFEKLAPKKS
ncbi:TPR Domain containing protein [Chitinispirillum alkaliphilum]|nr:TPR Domain containing protein [Chitinispirillum alkaliphilum]